MVDYKLIHSDAIKWARRYAAHRKCGEGIPLYHALLCDPPYHLQSITKRFGKAGSKQAQYGRDGAFQRTSKGFMGKTWDGGDVAFRPETWRAFYRILHPGAFGMAFGGSRTSHRMATAIEDAGFRIFPLIGWVYGSGFPKATRLDTQIDKAAGKEQEVLGTSPNWRESKRNREKDGKMEVRGKNAGLITKPTTDLAHAWQGHRYGLQALKPALEPIIVFQKPYEGRPIDSMVKTGAGALNIDKARIGGSDDLSGGSSEGARQNPMTGDEREGKALGLYAPGAKRAEKWEQPQGRWPANFTISHAPECRLVGSVAGDGYTINRFTDGAKPFGHGAGHKYESEQIEGGQVPVYECVEGCAVRKLDEQSGNLGKSSGGRAGHTGAYQGGYKEEYYGDMKPGYGDKGGASRFFYNADWTQEQLEGILPIHYQAKAAKSERNAGLGEQNPHPTIKAISLTRWLASLLLPPDLYAPRRLFIPFAGVASEMIGAYQAGWEIATGIEMEKEYVQIGQARLDHWLSLDNQLGLE